MGRVREEKKKEDHKRESLRRNSDPGARKGRKVAEHGIFPMICGSRGWESRLAKAAGAEPAGQMRDQNCTPLWREAHFKVKSVKN